MSYLTVSDLVRTLQLRRQTGGLSAAISRHSQELTTGRTANPTQTLRGDYTPLTGIERSRTTLSAFANTITETALHAAAQQKVLDRLLTDTAELAEKYLVINPEMPPQIIDKIAAEGGAAFRTAVAALNEQIAGRALFSGTATDRRALAPAQDILAAVLADPAVAAATTAADLDQAISDWFLDPGNGVAFLGEERGMGPFAVAPGLSVNLDVTARSAEIRAALARLAVGAAVDAGALAGDPRERALALRDNAAGLLNARTGIVALAGELGGTEARIEAARIRNEAELAAMEIARTDLIGVDPFEAGVRLEEAIGRLDTLFTLTSRLQRLNLTEYLR